MKKLAVRKIYEDKFTIVVEYPDFSGLPHDGVFPSVYEYYVIDTEEELIQILNSEEVFLVEDIDTIYFAGNSISAKYLKVDVDKGYPELLDHWKIPTSAEEFSKDKGDL
jgi:hypothetical protein